MKMDGDGPDRTPGSKVKPAAGLEPAGFEIVKRRAPLSLEDQSLYLSLLEELTAEKQPANLRESALVEEVARNYVRLKRAQRLETETLDKCIAEVQSRFARPVDGGRALALVFIEHGAQLESMQRKEAKIEDAWYRAMAELDREQSARLNRQPEMPGDSKSKRIHLVKKRKLDG
jgi:hypothetical protein